MVDKNHYLFYQEFIVYAEKIATHESNKHHVVKIDF